MRHLLSILLIFCFLSGFSQPISYRSNNQITVLDYNFFAGNSLRVPVYKDTLAANSAYTLDSCGKMIYTYTANKLWYRACNPKRWLEIVSSGSNIPTFQTTLDNSSVLNKNNLIETNGKRFLIDNDNGLSVRSRANFRLDTISNQLYLGNNTDTFAGIFQLWNFRDNLNTNYTLKKGAFTSRLDMRGDSLTLECGTPSKFSKIIMDSSGIKFVPPLDSFSVPNLEQVLTIGDTAQSKIELINRDNGIPTITTIGNDPGSVSGVIPNSKLSIIMNASPDTFSVDVNPQYIEGINDQLNVRYILGDYNEASMVLELSDYKEGLGITKSHRVFMDTSDGSGTYRHKLPVRDGFFVKALNSVTADSSGNITDTTSFPLATFGAGSGAAGDTSAFTTSAIYGSFYLNAGSDTIIVTGYTGVAQGTSASVTPTIYFNDSLNVTAGATKIVNSPSAVTSTTTGNTVTSLDNTKIPPGNFVWVKTETVTTKPTYFNLTLIGYRKR